MPTNYPPLLFHVVPQSFHARASPWRAFWWCYSFNIQLSRAWPKHDIHIDESVEVELHEIWLEVTIHIVVITLAESFWCPDTVPAISSTAPSSASIVIRIKSGKSVYTPEIDIPGVKYLPTIHLPPPLLCPGGSATVRVVKEERNPNGL
jgi:hypothetical protein